jgi:hypothetical protein
MDEQHFFDYLYLQFQINTQKMTTVFINCYYTESSAKVDSRMTPEIPVGENKFTATVTITYEIE